MNDLLNKYNKIASEQNKAVQFITSETFTNTRAPRTFLSTQSLL